MDYMNMPGAGAAGGLGFGLMVFAGAEIRSGIQAILDITGFDQNAAESDLIISGEGNLDGQSIFGKVPIGIAQRVSELNKPVIVIAGGIDKGAEKVYEHGISAVISSTCRPMSVEEAMTESGELLADAAERAMRLVRLGIGMRTQDAE